MSPSFMTSWINSRTVAVFSSGVVMAPSRECVFHATPEGKVLARWRSRERRWACPRSGHRSRSCAVEGWSTRWLGPSSPDLRALSRSKLSRLGGGPPGTRTRNLRIKSPLLYPIELEAREREYIKLMRLDRGVTEGTRTPNPQDHNLVL